MNDREIFRKNLNYFLSSTGKMQKDLAEFVGAKTTTVSGWTRGISYPRADAMEKIALFFGVPTSRLVSEFDSDPSYTENVTVTPKTSEAKLISVAIDKLPKEQREQAVRVMQAVFAQYADYFDEKGINDDETT